MIVQLKNKLRRFSSIQKLWKLHKMSNPELSLIYLTEEYYTAVKLIGDQELEHQIGRLKNYKKIISELKDGNIQGDVIEFGSWQGFSLLWISYFLEREAIFDKKIIGLDSFGGLPNSEGVFSKGAFSDTSLHLCRKHVSNSKALYDITKNNINVEQFLFSQKVELSLKVKEITQNKFCLIHIDCDISSSLNEIFEILLEGDMLANTCYILFDDYGCMESYKNSVDLLMKKMSDKFEVGTHSQTRFTKNFLLKRI